MRKRLINFASVLLSAIVVVTVVVAWEVYAWRDCRMVGHTWLYCAMNMGR